MRIKCSRSYKEYISIFSVSSTRSFDQSLAWNDVSLTPSLLQVASNSFLQIHMPFSPKATRTVGREATQSLPPLSAISTPFHELSERLSLTSTQLKFVFLCLLWYMSSALSNNSAKQILNTFKAPVTLTFIQFAFISGWCGLLAVVQQLRGRNSRALFGAKNGIRFPTREIILTTLPMSFFQIAGHIFGSLATSQIPVSVVHTVKVASRASY